MLTNEFQSMIEQYSNELMNISKDMQNISAEPEKIVETSCSEVEAVPAPLPAVPPAEPVGKQIQPRTETPVQNVPQNPYPVERRRPSPDMPQDSYRPAVDDNDAPSRQPTELPSSMNNTAPRPATARDKYFDDSENMTYEQFLNSNPESGYLKVQVFSGNQINPISGAEVVVSKAFADGEQIFFQGLTDISGIVDNIELPAPSREISEAPQPRGDGAQMKMPYSQYNITVKEPMHIDQEYTHVPIFSGVKSIQPVRMTPLQFGSGGQNGAIIFTESEPNDL